MLAPGCTRRSSDFNSALSDTGLNQHGEPHEWQVRGWPARIVQHEMDHLEGCLYIDRMNSRTFQFNYWQYIKRLPKSRKLF